MSGVAEIAKGNGIGKGLQMCDAVTTHRLADEGCGPLQKRTCSGEAPPQSDILCSDQGEGTIPEGRTFSPKVEGCERNSFAESCQMLTLIYKETTKHFAVFNNLQGLPSKIRLPRCIDASRADITPRLAKLLCPLLIMDVDVHMPGDRRHGGKKMPEGLNLIVGSTRVRPDSPAGWSVSKRALKLHVVQATLKKDRQVVLAAL